MLKRNALMATLLGVGLLVVTGAVGAQQKGTSGTPKAMMLTPLDYIEIRQLVSSSRRRLPSPSSHRTVLVGLTSGSSGRSGSGKSIPYTGRRASLPTTIPTAA